MAYKMDTPKGCTRKLVFNFEKLDLKKEIEAAIVRKQKNVSLKGFRQGKAPLHMVKQIYGAQVEGEALDQFIQKEFYEAVTKENLKVVGYPAFENLNYKAGESINFDVTVEVFPEFELNDHKGLSFSKEKIEVTDAEIEDIKKGYLNSRAQMVAISEEKTALKKGHTAVMNFQGVRANGDKPENMKGHEFLLEIGSGQFIPGFEDGMIGMKKGEKKIIDVNFPENYHMADLQKENVKFDVELVEIKEKILPDFTDELCKEFGYESIADFQAKSKKQIEYRKERQVKEKLHQQVLEKLVEMNSFDVPNTLIERQKEYLKDDIKKNLMQQGFNEEMTKQYFEKWVEDLNTKAAFQVRSGLILDKLARKYNIESTDTDLEKKIKETSESMGLEEEQVRKYYNSSSEVKQNLMFAIREEKTFEKLLEELKVS